MLGRIQKGRRRIGPPTEGLLNSMESARCKKRRAASPSRRADTITSMTWLCWSTARYT
jgi:hypothetical protein